MTGMENRTNTTNSIPVRNLGTSTLQVPLLCLGTMTFGEQVCESNAWRILAHSLERGLNFLDTAEMYPVPPRPETYTATETIIGNWFARNPGMRQRWIVATKVAGPGRHMRWIRDGKPDLSGADIIAACESSLRRLRTDFIDLYQIHWPTRNVPAFGNAYYTPEEDTQQVEAAMLEQLQALDTLARAGKVGAVGLSNETPYGVHSFVHLAQTHNLVKIASVQNPYTLLHRAYDNGLDETLHRLDVGFLAYSPLGYGLLTGKYDTQAPGQTAVARGRLDVFASMRAQRWGRADSLQTAKRYNQLAQAHGLTPTQMALAFCYQRWSVTSTIIGVTTTEQLDECLAARTTKLAPELLVAIDDIRRRYYDPAQ